MGFRVWGVCLRRAEYPCADGATPLPGICGWRHILRTANFVDVAQEAIETGLSSTLPPAVTHHGLAPELLPVSLEKIVFSLPSKEYPAAGGPGLPKTFHGPVVASRGLRACRELGWSRLCIGFAGGPSRTAILGRFQNPGLFGGPTWYPVRV